MPEELVTGGAGKDGKLTVLDAANTSIVEVRRKEIRPGVLKFVDLRLGAQDILGTLSLHNRANQRRASLTGDGQLHLGGAASS
jgi:hypothetical protein